MLSLKSELLDYFKQFQFLSFLTVITLWSVLLFALPDFFDNPIESIKSIIMIGAYLLFIFIAVFPLMVSITANKYIAMVVIPLYATLGSIVAYYRVSFHATVTVVMIDAVMNTTIAEASGVMTKGLYLFIILNVIVSASLLYWRFKYIRVKHSFVTALCGIIAVTVLYNLNEQKTISLAQRFPYNIFYYGKQYYSFMVEQSQPRDMIPAQRISTETDSLIVIFVIGEAIRSDHLSINGYPRITMPLLSNRDNIISMGDVWTPYTNTGSAIPYMLTPANEQNRKWAQTKESFIPYYKELGYNTVWLSNQDMGNGYSYFINSVDTSLFVNRKNSVWTFDTWTDSDLLHPLHSCLEKTHAKELYVLHTVGAHWYYDLHYTDAITKFSPTTSTRVVGNNAPEEVINSYDNCILYMDAVVDSIITMIHDKESILVYQSDHGESLGEDGVWLHATDEEMQHHPAGFIWYSDKYQQKHSDVVEYIESIGNRNKKIDFVFPLMLRIIGLGI